MESSIGRKITILFIISIGIVLLNCHIAISETLLWPFEVGLWTLGSVTDNTGKSWSMEIEVIEEAIYGSQKYFHVRKTNYKPGQVVDYYARSTDKAVYFFDGTNEVIVLQIAPVGTKWSYGDTVTEITAIEYVTVPYGGPYLAYVHRNYNSSNNSPYWYDYVVPGISVVKEVNYSSSNAPTTMLLLNVSKKYTIEELNQAVLNERRRYDPSGDGKIGLEEAIYALQILSGVR